MIVILVLLCEFVITKAAPQQQSVGGCTPREKLKKHVIFIVPLDTAIQSYRAFLKSCMARCKISLNGNRGTSKVLSEI